MNNISQHRQELKKLARSEEKQVAYLDAIAKEISLVEDLVEQLKIEESELKSNLNELTNSLVVGEEKLDSAREIQAQVVREMYINGRLKQWTFLLSGEGMDEFFSRIGLLWYLSQSRKELSEQLQTQNEKVISIRDSVNSVKQNVAQKRKLKESELDSLEKAKLEKQKVLKEIRNDKESYTKAIKEMERSLEQLKNRLPTTSLSGNFEKCKGNLPWPTSSRNIIHKFGLVKESRFGTQFRNAGIDIATDGDEPVLSVADGRIAQIYWLRGYGNLVVIEHPGGYFTVYGNLGKVWVEKGRQIDQGIELGRTAEDGWLEGTKLHFEIRKGKQEVNPIEWLIAA